MRLPRLQKIKTYSRRHKATSVQSVSPDVDHTATSEDHRKLWLALQEETDQAESLGRRRPHRHCAKYNKSGNPMQTSRNSIAHPQTEYHTSLLSARWKNLSTPSGQFALKLLAPTNVACYASLRQEIRLTWKLPTPRKHESTVLRSSKGAWQGNPACRVPQGSPCKWVVNASWFGQQDETR